MKPAVLAFALFAVTILGAPGSARAQGPRVSPSAVVPLARTGAAETDLRVPPVDLYELGRYAGWGGAIGGALGVAYALAFEHGSDRKLMIVSDGVVGFTGGLVVGTAVYLVKLVRESR
ncbi:MAG: hypothetical protein ABR499_20290 [Gemmatimonadaceae bacterium]